MVSVICTDTPDNSAIIEGDWQGRWKDRTKARNFTLWTGSPQETWIGYQTTTYTPEV